MTAQASIPLKWYVPFAQGDTARVELPVTTSDPTRASQTLGFPPLTMQPPESGGVPPQGEDFNGGMNQVARVAWWILNGGQWQYDSTFATNSNINGYPKGAYLQSADSLGNWINTADNNQNNPDTTGTNWVPGFQYGTTALTGLTGGTVTPTPAQAAKGSITLAGTLTSALTVILPNWVTNWTITNSTTGAFVTIVKTAAGSGVTIPQNASPTRVSGDGTNIVQAAENVAAATLSTQPLQLGQATGRLLRTSVYSNVGGVQFVSVNGGAATTTGASTFNPLALTTSVDVEVLAGGGSGGGTGATSGSQSAIASGGGAGGYARQVFTSGFSSVAIVVGDGGMRTAPGANAGNPGQKASFGALLYATGGVGGFQGVTSGTFPFSVGSAPGGLGFNGSVNAQGGAATTSSVLSLAQLVGSFGGQSYFGQGGQPFNLSGNGQDSQSPGAGGGGAVGGPGQPAFYGGAGGAGRVIVREYA